MLVWRDLANSRRKAIVESQHELTAYQIALDNHRARAVWHEVQVYFLLLPSDEGFGDKVDAICGHRHPGYQTY